MAMAIGHTSADYSESELSHSKARCARRESNVQCAECRLLDRSRCLRTVLSFKCDKVAVYDDF